MDIDSINKHSPWWARIIAIVFGFIVLGSVVNVFYLEYFGIAGINHYSFGNEPEDPGDYPLNGTEDDQRNYNWSLQEWEEYLSYQSMVQDLEESNVKEISQAFAALTIMIGIPAIAVFWTQNEKMLHFGIAFGTVKVVGDVLTAYISSEIVAKYMESMPGGGDYSWIAKSSVFSSACCGLLFIGLAVVLSNMYHSSKQIPDSGFHLKVNLIANSEE
mgnify:FL=1|tara:strand:+ start:27 stop:674 length:648 start_codon:yes stop_codon:yes gene_type:complete